MKKFTKKEKFIIGGTLLGITGFVSTAIIVLLNKNGSVDINTNTTNPVLPVSDTDFWYLGDGFKYVSFYDKGFDEVVLTASIKDRTKITEFAESIINNKETIENL